MLACFRRQYLRHSPERTTPAATPHAPANTDPAERIRELEAAVRARDDFLATAAHELRGPLHALGLSLSMLEHMAADRADSAMLAQVRRTRRTVDRYSRRAAVLLDVARLNAGELTLSRTHVAVADLVKEVVDMHADEAAFHRTPLTSRIDTHAVGYWDAQMIEQVLSNLVNNAIKYGGATPVSLHASERAGSVVFEVSDRGPGIAPEHRARIFDKFERVVRGASSRSGYGLGLWIVGSMVDAHGGTIDVSCPSEGGSVFRVILPLRTP
jgi:signal transduction histidine kinase